MQSQELVILHCNLTIAQSLLSALRSSFPSIHHVCTVEELRASIAKHRPSIAIVDMENASLLDLQQLASEFPGACLVCTHRCADEQMWAAALNAGATDLLSSLDTRGIVQAALRTDNAARIAAA